jgi:hypothetical protein
LPGFVQLTSAPLAARITQTRWPIFILNAHLTAPPLSPRCARCPLTTRSLLPAPGRPLVTVSLANLPRNAPTLVTSVADILRLVPLDSVNSACQANHFFLADTSCLARHLLTTARQFSCSVAAALFQNGSSFLLPDRLSDALLNILSAAQLLDHPLRTAAYSTTKKGSTYLLASPQNAS